MFRNKRRSLTAITGVILAITLISGGFIAIDTTANSMLKEMLDVVPVDYLVYTNNESYDEIIGALKIQDVTQVEVTAKIEYMEIGKWGTNNTIYSPLYGLRLGAEDYLVKILSAQYIMVEDIIGDFNLTSGGIVLQDYQAEELDVEVGDTIHLTHTSYWWNGTDDQTETRYYNMTVSSIVTFQLIESFGYIYNEPVSFFHIDDRSTIIEELNYTSPFFEMSGSDPFAPSYIYFSNYTFYVWANRDKLIVAGDIEKTKENYVIMERTLRNSLSNVLAPSEFSIETSRVILIMSGFDFFLLMLRLVFLGISLPAIALGVYLSLISIEVGMTRRNRELGILRARGATKGQLFGLLLIESLILGIIAGIIGLLLGVVVSKIFLAVTPVASYFVENIYGIYISTTSLIIAVLFSIILIMIASYRPAKRITSLSEVEMLRYNPEGEVKTPYKPTIDIFFIGLAVFTFALMFIVRSVSSGDMSMFAFLCMLNLALIFLTPISVFCFIIGVTRLLTRSTTKIYDLMSRAVKFITKDLWYIVNRNIVRNPRRTSSVCLIIAIGLAFGMVVSSFMETEYAYQERSVKGIVGGDLSVDASYEANLSFADNLTAVDGVELLTPVIILSTSGFEEFIAFNASAYYEIVEPEEFYFSEGEPRQTIEKLRTEGNVIVNRMMANDLYLRVGDTYSTEIHYPSGDTEFDTFTIVGIAKLMPGLGSGIQIFGYSMYNYQIFADISNLNMSAMSNGATSLKFLVKVSEGYNPSLVADEIEAMYPSVSVHVLNEELESIQQNPITGALYNSLMLIYFFTILIITFGLGLVVYFAAVERENELAGFIARGASTKQVSSLLLGEGTTIMLVGVVIGVFTGLLGAYMFNELFSFTITNFSGLTGVAIERAFIVSWQTLTLIIVTIVALVIAGFIGTLRVRMIRVAKALRERGG